MNSNLPISSMHTYLRTTVTMPKPAINKPVNLKQGYKLESKLEQYATEFFRSNPAEHRTKRERRRFKVPDVIFICNESYYESDGDVPPNKGPLLFVNEDNGSYYESCEMTLDTVANSSYPLEKLEKIQDLGGDFMHSLLEYRNWKTATVDTLFESETLIKTCKGSLRCMPDEFYEHDDVKIAECLEPPKEDYDMSSEGPSLWASMRPTKPVMDLGVAIAELRDIPRMLKHSWTSIKSLTAKLSAAKALLQQSPLVTGKKVAEWVLAIQFGWLPLYSDLERVLKLRGDVEKRLNYIKENANKSLHRIAPKKPWQPKVTEEVIETYESSENDSLLCKLSFDPFPLGADPDSIPNRFKSSIKLRKTVTTGATGMFRYYWDGKIPHDDYLRARLTGIVLTERVAWEAFPWLWLFDWFSNAGKVLSNMKDHMEETTVAPIAYAQRHIIREYTWECSNGFYTASVTRVFDTKVRRKIDPFGLAASASLTSIQKVILAALALTRVRH